MNGITLTFTVVKVCYFPISGIFRYSIRRLYYMIVYTASKLQIPNCEAKRVIEMAFITSTDFSSYRSPLFWHVRLISRQEHFIHTTRVLPDMAEESEPIDQMHRVVSLPLYVEINQADVDGSGTKSHNKSFKSPTFSIIRSCWSWCINNNDFRNPKVFFSFFFRTDQRRRRTCQIHGIILTLFCCECI